MTRTVLLLFLSFAVTLLLSSCDEQGNIIMFPTETPAPLVQPQPPPVQQPQPTPIPNQFLEQLGSDMWTALWTALLTVVPLITAVIIIVRARGRKRHHHR